MGMKIKEYLTENKIAKQGKNEKSPIYWINYTNDLLATRVSLSWLALLFSKMLKRFTALFYFNWSQSAMLIAVSIVGNLPVCVHSILAFKKSFLEHYPKMYLKVEGKWRKWKKMYYSDQNEKSTPYWDICCFTYCMLSHLLYVGIQ